MRASVAVVVALQFPLCSIAQTKESYEASKLEAKGVLALAQWLNDVAVRVEAERKLDELAPTIERELKPGMKGALVEVLVRRHGGSGQKVLGCVRFHGTGASVDEVLRESLSRPSITDSGSTGLLVDHSSSRFLWYERTAKGFKRSPTPSHEQTLANATRKS